MFQGTCSTMLAAEYLLMVYQEKGAGYQNSNVQADYRLQITTWPSKGRPGCHKRASHSGANQDSKGTLNRIQTCLVPNKNTTLRTIEHNWKQSHTTSSSVVTSSDDKLPSPWSRPPPANVARLNWLHSKTNRATFMGFCSINRHI